MTKMVDCVYVKKIILSKESSEIFIRLFNLYMISTGRIIGCKYSDFADMVADIVSSKTVDDFIEEKFSEREKDIYIEGEIISEVLNIVDDNIQAYYEELFNEEAA